MVLKVTKFRDSQPFCPLPSLVQKGSNQDQRSCEKVGKNMALRNLNALLYAFAAGAKTLQSGSSGSVSNR